MSHPGAWQYDDVFKKSTERIWGQSQDENGLGSESSWGVEVRASQSRNKH